MSSLPKAYDQLCRRFREASLLQTTASVLRWDQETGMPEAAGDFRAEQLAYLDGQSHRLTTAPEIDDLLKACEDAGLPDDSVAGTNVRGWRHDYDLAVKLPAELVEEFSRTTALAHQAWVEARAESKFAHFAPHLEEIVRLCRRKADCWGWEECRYDALLDVYEPGARTSHLTPIFDDLAPKVSAMLDQAIAKSEQVPGHVLHGQYPVVAQQKFNAEVASALGFDFRAGAIAVSAHPFCTELGPRDTRMTTRFNETDFLSSLYGVMHETGHALYEQGLAQDEWGRPAGSAVSLGIHESQSRLWENHVGRSLAFWNHWLPKAVEHFPHLGALSAEEITAQACRVRRSFIRVEADEVTYDLHIALRFALERQIINGDLEVNDIPGAWNALFERYFGLQVPDDAHGCLQDIHWSFGGFGYFATYTLGNLNASQLMRKAEEVPGLISALEAGDYGPLLKFVRNGIHQHGRRHSSQALMHAATGESTQPDYHLEYLKSKYV